ncbi:MAG TPA: SRPBCC family protein [Solirubrobacteraceae bacterium]|nr:SRPBCC family protein [Solirubrobacteraceae bacterium]
MKPIAVATVVDQDVETVYDFLDLLSAHEKFTDHMLAEWRLSGPERGVGAKVAVVATLGGKRDPVDIEVVEAERPTRIVERNVSAGGRRVAYGTYQLAPGSQGSTRITFSYALAAAPFSERLLSPVIRAVMRRTLKVTMRRLRDELAHPGQTIVGPRPPEEAASSASSTR